MAPKSRNIKPRIYQSENKLLKLDKLQLQDVICSICQSILIEPVTLPCYHDFCKNCFTGSIENNALCCPLCRLRIGSWLRKTSKENNLVNNMLWDFVQEKFSHEISTKLKGGDIDLIEDVPQLRLSAPGEIRSEYEAEMKRLKKEQLEIERKHLQETELLIQKLQKEEEETHKKHLQLLKQDELIAKNLQDTCVLNVPPILTSLRHATTRQGFRKAAVKSKLKTTKIDSIYEKKSKIPKLNIDKKPSDFEIASVSDTSIASCSKKDEIYDFNSEKEPDPINIRIFQNKNKTKSSPDKSDKQTQSVMVSIPFKNLLQNKINKMDSILDSCNGSVDSMSQELYYFKPIQPTRMKTKSSPVLPVAVPTVRSHPDGPQSHSMPPQPSRSDYLQGLGLLRKMSFTQNLPSAFVLVLKMLQDYPVSKKETPRKLKNQTETINLARKSITRTRSMCSLKNDETTPKKSKLCEKKSQSERKHQLRSNTKNSYLTTIHSNHNKVDSVAKDLSKSLDTCHVQTLLKEQLRIERMIEQEKKDFLMAKKIDEEINRKRRVPPVKRQVTLYGLRPAKKLHVA